VRPGIISTLINAYQAVQRAPRQRTRGNVKVSSSFVCKSNLILTGMQHVLLDVKHVMLKDAPAVYSVMYWMRCQQRAPASLEDATVHPISIQMDYAVISINCQHVLRIIDRFSDLCNSLSTTCTACPPNTYLYKGGCFPYTSPPSMTYFSNINATERFSSNSCFHESMFLSEAHQL